MGDGRWRGRLAIGIVIRVNHTAGGVEVGESALIRAVEGCWTLLDNEPLLRWFDRSRLGGGLFGGVGIGTSDRTVGLYTTGAVDQATLSPHSVFLLSDGSGSLVGLLCGCERKLERALDEVGLRLGRTCGGWLRGLLL